MSPEPPKNPKPRAVLPISLISKMLNIGFEKLKHIDRMYFKQVPIER